MANQVLWELDNKELVVNISTVGVVTALHMDKFDLGFLGDKVLSRAATIDFDEEDQSFFVLPSGYDVPIVIATQFSGYDVARCFEIDWLQECMKAQCKPYDEQGRIIANSIRTLKPGLYKRTGKQAEKANKQ